MKCETIFRYDKDVYVKILHNSNLYFTDCPSWKFGQKCLSNCNCQRTTTSSCQNTDGTCLCIAGYQGSKCESSEYNPRRHYNLRISDATKCYNAVAENAHTKIREMKILIAIVLD